MKAIRGFEKHPFERLLRVEMSCLNRHLIEAIIEMDEKHILDRKMTYECEQIAHKVLHSESNKEQEEKISQELTCSLLHLLGKYRDEICK